MTAKICHWPKQLLIWLTEGRAPSKEAELLFGIEWTCAEFAICQTFWTFIIHIYRIFLCRKILKSVFIWYVRDMMNTKVAKLQILMHKTLCLQYVHCFWIVLLSKRWTFVTCRIVYFFELILMILNIFVKFYISSFLITTIQWFLYSLVSYVFTLANHWDFCSNDINIELVIKNFQCFRTFKLKKK